MNTQAGLSGSSGCGKVSAGCLSTVGAFFLLVMIGMIAEGDWEGIWGSALFAIGPFGLAAVAYARARAADRALLAREQEVQEQHLLRSAARHGGRVTPALAAMEAPGLTILEAKALLDRLAAAGLCAVESGDEGSLYYVFDLSTPRRPRREAEAPEEWVARRMTGRADDPAGRYVDDEA